MLKKPSGAIKCNKRILSHAFSLQFSCFDLYLQFEHIIFMKEFSQFCRYNGDIHTVG